MILWGIFEEKDTEESNPQVIKHAVFASKRAALWFLHNYPEAKGNHWFTDTQGSVNW
jgi:hypothetical protein